MGNGPTLEPNFRRVREVFESALQQPPDQRLRFVEEACAGDTVLMSDVQRMLTADAQSYSLLDGGNFAGARLPVNGIFAGHFEILGILGRGGMGEVYRGRDTNLQRSVALKILPAAFTRDPDRLSRFRREAQVLASLNHPNIGAIYSFEEENGVQALALELIEGPTLADRIQQGPIPLDEALTIARKIAEALEAAHEQGIVHRDLKPSNVKLRPDGAVKVLDFGLAKALQAPESSRPGSEPPDLTSPAMLAMGLLIGTPAYMAPEQARGRAVDKRADIWAFGAVLYEMLSGRRAFPGEDLSETLASVLKHEVDWTALPSSTPEAVRRLIERCLQCDPKQRLRDIGEARILLDDPRSIAPAPHSARKISAAVPLLVALVLLALTAAGGISWYVTRKAGRSGVSRFLISAPEDQTLNLPSVGSALTISPDGRHLVYVANDRLYLRPISEFSARPIPGTENPGGPTDPVFSPDGLWVAFFARRDGTIKKIPVAGGSAVTICSASMPYGMRWTPDGIYFGQASIGIRRVSCEGGEPEVVVPTSPGDLAHGADVLPGGRLLLTLATGTGMDRWDRSRVILATPRTGQRTTLIEGGSDARYLATGHLIYANHATLFAVPFDSRRGKLTGGAVPVVEGVFRSAGRETGAVQISYSSNGDLVYVPGLDVTGRRYFLGFSDRMGKIERLNILPGSMGSLSISPDGARIALASDSDWSAENPGIVWIYDTGGNTAVRRLTYTGRNRFPIWTADSTRVVFQSDREGDQAIFWQKADGTGVAERLTRADKGTSHVPESWSPKSDTLLYSVESPSGITLRTLSLKIGKSEPFGDVRSVSPPTARFSPDGQWIAYAIAERPGPTSIYVQPFPATGAKYQLIVKGSHTTPHKPMWSPDGKELFYIPGFGRFEAVPVSTRPEFAFGSPTEIVRSFTTGSPNSRALFDVAPDGRFVAFFDAERPARIPRMQDIAVVLNWFEELKARVPVR